MNYLSEFYHAPFGTAKTATTFEHFDLVTVFAQHDLPRLKVKLFNFSGYHGKNLRIDFELYYNIYIYITIV